MSTENILKISDHWYWSSQVKFQKKSYMEVSLRLLFFYVEPKKSMIIQLSIQIDFDYIIWGKIKKWPLKIIIETFMEKKKRNNKNQIDDRIKTIKLSYVNWWRINDDISVKTLIVLELRRSGSKFEFKIFISSRIMSEIFWIDRDTRSHNVKNYDKIYLRIGDDINKTLR